VEEECVGFLSGEKTTCIVLSLSDIDLCGIWVVMQPFLVIENIWMPSQFSLRKEKDIVERGITGMGPYQIPFGKLPPEAGQWYP
jgi:hypothetical protein